MKRRSDSSCSSSSEDIPLMAIKVKEYKFVKERILRMRTREQCEICLKFFNNKYNYLIHNVSHIIIPLMKLEFRQCTRCLRYFTSQDDLDSHITEYHTGTNITSDTITSIAVAGTTAIWSSVVTILDSETSSDKSHNVVYSAEKGLNQPRGYISVRKNLFSDSVNPFNNICNVKEEPTVQSTRDSGVQNEFLKEMFKEPAVKTEDNPDSIRNRIVFEDDTPALPSNIMNDIVNECQDALDLIEPTWLLNNLTRDIVADTPDESKSCDSFDILNMTDDIDILNANDLCKQIVADSNRDVFKAKSAGVAHNGASLMQNGANVTQNGVGILQYDPAVLQNGAGILLNGAGILQNGAGILPSGILNRSIIPTGAGIFQNGAGIVINGSGILENSAGILINGADILQQSGGTLPDRVILQNGAGVFSNGVDVLPNGVDVLQRSADIRERTLNLPDTSNNSPNFPLLSSLLKKDMAEPNFKAASKIVLNNSNAQNNKSVKCNNRINKSVNKIKQTKKRQQIKKNSTSSECSALDVGIRRNSCIDCLYNRSQCRHHGIGTQQHSVLTQQSGTTQHTNTNGQPQGVEEQHRVSYIQNFQGWLLQRPGPQIPQYMIVDQPRLQSLQTSLQTQQNGLEIQKTDLQIQHSDLHTQQSCLQTQQNGLQYQKSGLQTQQSRLQTEQSGLQTQQSGLQTQKSRLQIQQSGLQYQKSGLKTQQSDLQTQQSCAQNENNRENRLDWPAGGTIAYSELIKPGIYKCKRCCKIYPNRLKLLKHEPTHIIFDRSKPDPCCFCERYLLEGDMTRHCSIHHNGSVRGGDLTPKRCRICGLNTFNWSLHYNLYHNVAKVQTAKVLDVCNTCFREVKSKFQDFRVSWHYEGVCVRCKKRPVLRRVTDWKKVHLADRLNNIQKRLKLINRLNKY